MKPYGSVRQERGRDGCRCCPDKAERGRGRERGAIEREIAEWVELHETAWLDDMDCECESCVLEWKGLIVDGESYDAIVAMFQNPRPPTQFLRDLMKRTK